jgi:tRNA(fMet)-specific endonuclease VapC
MQFLLDTNTCIAAMRGKVAVVARMAALQPSDCAISTITAYELFTGLEKASQPGKERAKLEALLQAVHLLSFDASAAREAGRIRALLEAKGRTIGPYDVLIAAHALTAKLILVTSNTSEFARVPGLTLDDWKSST